MLILGCVLDHKWLFNEIAHIFENMQNVGETTEIIDRLMSQYDNEYSTTV